MPELNQEQINSIFETRIARIEVYLQKMGFDITQFDGPQTTPETINFLAAKEEE